MVACCFMFCATPRSALRLDLRVELRRPCDSDAIHKSLQGKKAKLLVSLDRRALRRSFKVCSEPQNMDWRKAYNLFGRSQNDVENEGRNNRKVTHPGKVSRSTTGVLIVRYRSRAHCNATRLLSVALIFSGEGAGL